MVLNTCRVVGASFIVFTALHYSLRPATSLQHAMEPVDSITACSLLHFFAAIKWTSWCDIMLHILCWQMKHSIIWLRPGRQEIWTHTYGCEPVHRKSLGVIILNIVACGKRTICAAFLRNKNDLSTGIARYQHSKFLTSSPETFTVEQNLWHSGDLPAEVNSNVYLCFLCNHISIQI